MRSITPLLLLFLGVAYAVPSVQYNYQNTKVLSDAQSPLFEIRWTLDAKNLRVAVIAETEEWMSLGFSADGTLQNSDGIIARVGQLGSHVEDYFVPSDNSCPETICADKVLGCSDNIADVRGKRVGKYVVIEYSRPTQASDNCDQSISAANGQPHFVHWAVGAREVLGMNIRTEQISFSSSNKKRSSTVEMIVLGGRELNMTILGNWFGHLTLEYWKNVDSSVVELDGNYNRQSFCSLNPDAVQVAGAELVTMNGYSIYAPKTKRSIKGTYIEWEVESVQVSAGYCTTPTTNTVPCSQYNPSWPECATEFVPLVISETSLADTWQEVCDSTANYNFVEQCPPSACWDVLVYEWPNSKYPDAAATTATGVYALADKYTSVEGQTNSNTFTRAHVRNVFNREITTDIFPGDREYPGNVSPVNVTDIWCGNKPWRTDIDPKPALKPCGTVKVATAPVTTTEAVNEDDLTYAVASFVNVEPSTVQTGYSTKQLGNGTEISISILDYGMRSGGSSLNILKLALSYNDTVLQQYGIPGSVSVGDITYEEVKVTEEGLSSASSVGISMILISALLVCMLFF